MFTLMQGDCLQRMIELPSNSVDTCLTDPPYGLSFMGKNWDKGVPGVAFWQEVFRVLKPGGSLLAFGGTRTSHRLTCAIEDAGFEIRDSMAWLYGSGFPKSLDISKKIDLTKKADALDVCKALDKMPICDIIEAWKNKLELVDFVATQSKNPPVKAGESTIRGYIVPESVAHYPKTKSKHIDAVIAELTLLDHQATLTGAGRCIAPENAKATTTQLRKIAIYAGWKSGDQRAILLTQKLISLTMGFIAQCDAKGLPKECLTQTTKEEEALMTLLGKQKYLGEEITSALYAEAAKNFKRIILNQSKTFQSLDTKSQTACACAISVIITESIMEHLITYTVNILRRKAQDRAEGLDREVVGTKQGIWSDNGEGRYNWNNGTGKGLGEIAITAPSSPLAQTWDGWGTAMKPSHEPITVAMKPKEGTFADNAERWGVAGLWIDGARIETGDDLSGGTYGGVFSASRDENGNLPKAIGSGNKGRFPANTIISHNHDCEDECTNGCPVKVLGEQTGEWVKQSDGSYKWITAARFFYTAKASRRERELGLPSPSANHHPTIKPLAIMRYLARLTNTPTGGVVLDPFMGSGTTGIAAILEGRRFIGIEQNSDYMNIAYSRITYFMRHGDYALNSQGNKRTKIDKSSTTNIQLRLL